MTIIELTTASKVPLFGLDFLGILDRGTNVLELKFTTICNLKCNYCFVSAGDYDHNFIIQLDYLKEWIQKAVSMKRCDDLEFHLAPYGEILTYPAIYDLIKRLRAIPEIKTISAQSNGLLLTPETINKLEEAGLDRLNISLNSLDAQQCAHLCGVPKYDLVHLLQMFDLVLQSKMDLLIAPVWFMGENDQGINDIIEFVRKKTLVGISWPKLRLGIQNYLTYKTGRKLKKIFSREFKFFYQRLRKMEQESGLKLKLGPNDFGIHKATPIATPFREGETASVEILMQGRWKDEFIARIQIQPNEFWAVKVLSNHPLEVGQMIQVRFIRGNLSGNLLTATYPQ
jgi:uncharacterized Fe-S cluster-containing radical SAM superfamily enzyme